MKKATIFSTICLLLGMGVAVASNVNTDKNLPYSQTQNAIVSYSTNFEDKDNFKDYCEEKLNIKFDSSTGNELKKLQTESLVSHLYNISKYLVNLDVSFKQIDNSEMKEIANEKNISEFSGLYNRDTHEILIVGGDGDTSVHEVGHAIYYQLLSPIDRLKINYLYLLDNKNLIDSYGQESKEEFFAVAFTEYIYDSEALKNDCPDTYKYFEKLNNNL